MSQNLHVNDNESLRKRPSPSSIDEYDFDLQHSYEKHSKGNNRVEKSGSRFFTVGRRQVTYSHNWSTESGKEKEELTVSSTRITTDVSALGKIKQAQQCVDSGELADFSQELEYILSTLLDANAAQNLKHLSAIQLVKKCTIAEFRRYLRTQNVLGKIFSALSDVQGSPMIALTTATIIYFLARDQKSVPMTDVTIRLISDLLRQEQSRLNSGDEFKKHTQTVWTIVKDWVIKCTERMKRPIHFGFTETSMTASFLMLEALAYISTREHNDFFKTELLNSGCLQWVVAKYKAVLKLSYSTTSSSTLLMLEEIERCFRILENAAAFNKKNQAYLINHRNGLLLEAGAKFLGYFKDFCEKYDDESSNTTQPTHYKVLNELLDCVCLLARVFMNVSHENEFCSKKLGQKEGFLFNCVTTLTLIAPRIVPSEKFFDLCVMMYGLLVNLVERCSSNRQKMVELNVQLYDTEAKISSTTVVLDALTKLFVKHDAAARTLDEELDNELAFEEPIEDDESSNQEPANASLSQQSTFSTASSSSQGEHRLQRPPEMTEDDMINAVKGAMSKASAHMEDSMLASYLSLLVGCILRTDQELADRVKALLPDENLSIMIEQLERFLEFMKLTKMKSGATRSIEQIIQSMQLL